MKKKVVLAFSIFLFFSLLYGVTARAKVQVTDEAAVLATAVSLATEHDLIIDEWQWLHEQDDIGARSPDGHLYTKYFPGNIFVGALLYKIGAKQDDNPYVWNHKDMAPSASGARLAMRLNALLGAAAVALVFLLVAQFYSWQTAVLTALFFGIGSDWWYQSRGFLSEIGAGTFTILSLYFATREKSTLSSAALGISLVFRPTNLLALPIWLLSVWRKGHKTWWSGWPIALSLGTLAFYNYHRFGSIVTSGYEGETFNSSLWEGLYGLLLSPGRSVFVYSPIFLLVLPGAVWWWRKDRRITAVCLLTIFSYLVVMSLWHRWDGGWTWGSRLLTPTLPLWGVLLAPAIEHIWTNKWLMGVTLLLVLMGTGVQILALARNPARILIVYVTGGEIPYDETLYTLRHSWIALQLREMSTWQPCDVDAHAVRVWLGNCRS
ncbi:MAG: hypothetical protein H6667_02230 [Ardenticatenaceae bacterium]|nr:hypothetical protein [Ardenticatenaceae bacterium]MCB9443327.1 hypothetical protein [Ardenticatenaceae bacterium]